MAARMDTVNKVDYSLLERFTELLICARCFRKHIRQPVRQLVSGRHRPLALCHECATKAAADEAAPVVRMRRITHQQPN